MMDYEGRIARVRERLQDTEADGLLVTELTNVRYLTGFSGTNGQVLVGTGGAVFFTDPRYEARAGALVEGGGVVIYPTRLTDVLGERLEAAGVKRLGFEAKTMTVAQLDDLKGRLDPTELVATTDLVENLRRYKEPAEVELIREAVRISDEAFAWMLERLVPGASERDIALQLEVHMREAGADSISFEPIVGSGELSAHIHHTPSERTLVKGDLVLFDFGSKWRGYCSDLTRTVVIGPASDEQRELYDLVLAAQGRGIERARSGESGSDVDAAARRVIEAAGHGDDFGHGLGHGVGLDIHEAPRLHRISEDTLAPGDVVTVEPGIYIKGRGGIRIEDIVWVRDEGSEVLGSAFKNELVEV